VLAVAALFALIQLPHAPGKFYPDSAQYLTQVYGLLGDSRAEGREKAIQAYCDQYRRQSLVLNPAGLSPKAAAACVGRLRAQNDAAPDTRYGPAITRGAPITSARYENIFLSRPAVAALYLPGVVIAGPRMGMWLTTLAWTLFGSVLVFLLLRRLGVSAGLSLLGQVLYLILPMRKWTMTPLAEGMTLALLMLCLLGAVHVLTGARRRGLLLMALGFGVGTFVKYSQFLLFAAALAGVLTIVLLVTRRRAARSVGGLAAVIGVSVFAAAAMLLLSRALGWPGSAETMQDLLTRHFREPDVADPFGGWLRRNVGYWQVWLGAQLKEPFLLVAWAAGAWGVLRFGKTAGYVVLATLLAGLANQVGHPNLSQRDRIYTVAWLLVVYGVPMLLHTFRARQQSTVDTVRLVPPQTIRPGAPSAMHRR
jgi:hypothetical protein